MKRVLAITLLSGITSVSAVAQTGTNATNANSGADPNAAGSAVGGEVVSIDVDSAFSSGVDRSSGTIGASASEAPAFSTQGEAAAGGATGRGAAGGALGALGAFGGAFNQLFGAGNQPQINQKILRTRLRSGIEVARPTGMVQATAIQQRIGKLAVGPRMAGVNIALANRVATLTGTVTSEKDRRLAEMLLKLEPGVSKVDNKLSIVASVDSVLEAPQ